MYQASSKPRITAFGCILALVALCHVPVNAQDDDELPLPYGSFDPSQVLRVKTMWPIFQETQREWTSAVDGRSVTARLGGRVPEPLAIIFYRADGERFEVDPNRFITADRAYALQKTEPRVNRSSIVFLGTMIAAIDGDSFQFRTIANEDVVVRLDGIDAPDADQRFGSDATDWMNRFKGQDLRVEYFERDANGRHVAQVYFRDRWLNYEMVLAGIAWHDDRVNVDRRLSGAHAYAKRKRLGMWKASELIAPWVLREKKQDPIEQAFGVSN